MTTKPYTPPLEVGDKVLKVGGDYGGPGVIVAMFQTTTGAWRYVVRHVIMAGKGEFCHIYSGNNLARRND
jgi:uncharacterized cupin superfamily protein